MKTIRGLAILSLLIAVVMAVMIHGAAEQAAINGEELPWKLFYGPLYPLGAAFALILFSYYLTTPSGQQWRRFRNERACARRVAAPAFASKPGYPDAMD